MLASGSGVFWLNEPLAWGRWWKPLARSERHPLAMLRVLSVHRQHRQRNGSASMIGWLDEASFTNGSCGDGILWSNCACLAFQWERERLTRLLFVGVALLLFILLLLFHAKDSFKLKKKKTQKTGASYYIYFKRKKILTAPHLERTVMIYISLI